MTGKANEQPCVNPFCDKGPGGARAMVNAARRSSGACCRAHMKFRCSHPSCVEKAQELGYEFGVHNWGTRIAEAHKAWRVTSETLAGAKE
jgi:hypothetical protein